MVNPGVALERAFFDVFEVLLHRIEQLVALGPGAVDDAAPKVVGLAGIPNRQRRLANIADAFGAWVILPQLLPGRLFVVVREVVAQRQERQHVIAAVIRVQ